MDFLFHLFMLGCIQLNTLITRGAILAETECDSKPFEPDLDYTSVGKCA